jgi:hypothetical protein
MEALTLDELLEYRNQAEAASRMAEPQGKEMAIDAKILLADQEIKKRKERAGSA